MQLNVKSLFLILLSDFEEDFMDIIFFLSQIDRLRKERKLTKAEFYERADITASAVSQWRNEKTVPAETTIQRIADLFGVEVSFLTGEQKNTAPISEDGKAEILSIFESLSPERRSKLLELARLYLADQSKSEESK